MKKLIGICGKTASGKNSLLEALIEKDSNLFKRKISHTTRERRDQEKEGQDYFFITDQQFFDMTLNDEFLEAAEVYGEFYGTALSNLSDSNINIGIFDPQGIEILSDNKKIDLLTIFVDTEENLRYYRFLERGGSLKELYERSKEEETLFHEIEKTKNCLIVNNDSSFEPNVERIIDAVNYFFKI